MYCAQFKKYLCIFFSGLYSLVDSLPDGAFSSSSPGSSAESARMHELAQTHGMIVVLCTK